MLPVYEGEIQCIALGSELFLSSCRFLDSPRSLPQCRSNPSPRRASRSVTIRRAISSAPSLSLVCPCSSGVMSTASDTEHHTLTSLKAFGLTAISVSVSEPVRRLTLTSFNPTGIVTGSQAGNGGGLLMLGRSDGVLNRELSVLIFRSTADISPSQLRASASARPKFTRCWTPSRPPLLSPMVKRPTFRSSRTHSSLVRRSKEARTSVSFCSSRCATTSHSMMHC